MNQGSKVFVCVCVQVQRIRLHVQTPQGRLRLMGCRSETIFFVSFYFLVLILHPKTLQEQQNSCTSASLWLALISSRGVFGGSLIQQAVNLRETCFFFLSRSDSTEKWVLFPPAITPCEIAPSTTTTMQHRHKFKDATASAYTPEMGNVELHLTAFLMGCVIEH